MTKKESVLTNSIEINGMVVKNRMVMPPMGTNFANPDHSVSDKQKKYYEARAKGGVGTIILEYSAVDPGGVSAPNQLGIFDDKHIPGLSELAQIAHKHGVKIGIEIHHGGRQCPAELCGQPVAPSPIAGVTGQVPKELTKEEINKITIAFAKAAARAKRAGLDFVDIHGAHGYLISQFMSPYYNKRTDEYGDTLEGFLRFPLEVLHAVRKEVGPNYPVLFRMNGEEHVEGGRTLKDSVRIAKRLAEEGVDAIDVSGGLIESAPWIIPTQSMRPGVHIAAATAIKAAVDVPVIVAGKIHIPELAEEIIETGKVDMVAFGRALIVDPEFPNKIVSGRQHEVRKCIYCLQHCLDIPAACTQNPEMGHEIEYECKDCKVTKDVMIIGGGPAGMEAARVASIRGHRVKLYEKKSKLGGQMTIATVPPYKSALNSVVDYRIESLENLGVEVQLGREVTVEDIKHINPEVVILATGGEPIKPNIEGIEGDRVVQAWDVLDGVANVGKNVLVVGGGSVGCETALFLANRGKKVTVVEMLEEVASDMAILPRIGFIERLDASVTVMKTAKLQMIGDGEVVVEDQGETKTLGGIDNVVLAIGTRAKNELAEALTEASPGIEVHVIGDARKPRTLWEAIGEGATIGHSL
jgi:2,4-dienoyl-CoA reductase-like NADH-dependent reductase (Old Yellow Enzyme family)/NADPH-dependent 2,4-dienoyl-CoA reductase/sulfur reductase-like enzyme